jgi:all-trans-retinol 13,14-reductase
MLDADTIVIGSGAGGLTAALCLAQAGERVLVLEQHYVPGGWCHSFRLGGYNFSPGVHYIGELGPDQLMRKIYEGLGVAGDLTFFQMNTDGYEHFRIGDKIFDLPSGKEAMVERFKARFPNEASGIEAYFFLVDTISKELTVIPETKSFKDFLAVPYRTRHVGRYGLYSLERILRDRISDPLLRAFLSVQCGDHGLPPSKIPFALHAAVAGHYLSGAYYPLGGGASIPKAFIRALRKENGAIWLSTPVDKMLIEERGWRRHAIGVRLRDGSELRANRVVSNATPHITYDRLVGREHLSRSLRCKLDRTLYSVSALSLFLATDLDLESMEMDSGNYWYVPNVDFEAVFERSQAPNVINDNEFPGIFMGITTIKDPSSFVDGHHTMEAITFLTHAAFSAYADSTSGERPQEYSALKRRLIGTMLKTIERIIPGIRDHILFCDLGTPLTNVHYVAATQGCCYGTEKSLGQIGPFGFKPLSEICGLGLCGASTFCHGVMGATLSGLGLAARFLRCRPSELLYATGHELQTYPADRPSQWPQWLHDKRQSHRVRNSRIGC